MIAMILEDSMYGRVIAGHFWSEDPPIFVGDEEPGSFIDSYAVNFPGANGIRLR